MYIRRYILWTIPSLFIKPEEKPLVHKELIHMFEPFVCGKPLKWYFYKQWTPQWNNA